MNTGHSVQVAANTHLLSSQLHNLFIIIIITTITTTVISMWVARSRRIWAT